VQTRPFTRKALKVLAGLHFGKTMFSDWSMRDREGESLPETRCEIRLLRESPISTMQTKGLKD
jgi:hypothetical protein